MVVCEQRGAKQCTKECRLGSQRIDGTGIATNGCLQVASLAWWDVGGTAAAGALRQAFAARRDVDTGQLGWMGAVRLLAG